MIALKALSLLCLAMGANAGLCKPSSSDTTTTASATSTTSTSTTSSAPCAAYTLISPAPAGKECNVAVSRGSSNSSPYFLTFPSSNSLEGCAKLCADRPTCVSFYMEFYSPAPNVYIPICALFSGLRADIGFGTDSNGHYYDEACFACDLD
ncbi:hypothetical protein AK830_g2625 [Neonectria ditissima]|uniref:Apple domain-containing protein n=1 Tax=Neonectria ditissima TaxID=78410 RepID=A0A0P7BAY0_9HYPO|nr:hypothetical protein AK830_g2625 [Neonectria ditissima]